MGARIAPQAGGYANGYESDILARPELQFPRADVVTDITQQVKDVVKVKNDNYTPKLEKKISYLLGAASVALIAFGIIAATVLSATGIGAGIMAAGLLVGAIGYYLYDKANEKKSNEEVVELVHDDAMHQRVGKVIQRYQDQDNGRGQVQGGRRRDDRREEAFVPHYARRGAAAGEANDDAWMRIAQ